MLSAIKTALIDLKDAISEQFEGRYTRSDFFFYNLLVGIIHGAVFTLVYLSVDDKALVCLINIPIAFFIYVPAMVKRAHDIGHCGLPVITSWLTEDVLCFIDIIVAGDPFERIFHGDDNIFPSNIPAFLVCLCCFLYQFFLLFKDSQKGTNKYGPSPKYPEKTSFLDKLMSYNKLATSVESDKLQESEDKNYSS